MPFAMLREWNWHIYRFALPPVLFPFYYVFSKNALGFCDGVTYCLENELHARTCTLRFLHNARKRKRNMIRQIISEN